MNIENNKIIAEFINYTIKENELFDNKDLYIQHITDTLKFDTDWNWLMEVVEKIESKGFNFEIKRNWARISRKGENIVLRWEEDRNKIDAVYNACVEFIKWYNQNK